MKSDIARPLPPSRKPIPTYRDKVCNRAGQRDRDIPTALRAAFGHKDLGVYLVTEQGGAVVVGDQVATPDSATAAAAPAPQPLAASPGRFICRGCYYIYDEAAGVPGSVAPGTPTTALPSSWRCPDCGTDAGKLQPYRGMAA